MTSQSKLRRRKGRTRTDRSIRVGSQGADALVSLDESHKGERRREKKEEETAEPASRELRKIPSDFGKQKIYILRSFSSP